MKWTMPFGDQTRVRSAPSHFVSQFPGSCSKPAQRRVRWLGGVVFATVGMALLISCRQKASLGEADNSNPSAAATMALASAAPTSDLATAAPSTSIAASNVAVVEPLVPPKVLLSLPITAYHAKIYLDGKVTHVLTVAGAYRIDENGKLSEFRQVLDSTSALTATSILFWSQDALWEVPRSGGQRRRIAPMPRQPQHVLASGHDFAWIDRNDDGVYTLQSVHKQKSRVLHSFQGAVDAALLYNGWVFFVERNADSSWRFGGLPLSGGTPALTANKGGRSPSMFAAASDLYYYDGNSRDVRLLSPDLQREQILIKDFICSPIAVADRIYCAQLGGLFEANKQTNAIPRRIYETKHSITAIVADSERVVWVNDVGENRLEVNELAVVRARR
ncbi:MAG TPA: hypothetical protein VKP30_11290 [Polyangiaceae bacterium]|nr:hypothetical protein [Polyangiaceae bacterium]